MKTIHCSSLPRLLSCPASGVQPEIEIDSTSQDALLGTAAHEGLAAVVRGEEWDAVQLAQKHGVDDAEQVKILIHCGAQIWREYSPLLENVTAETGLASIIGADVQLAGTRDVAGTSAGGELVLLDWKTGQESMSHRDQLIGYAYLAVDDISANHQPGENGPDGVKILVAWVRDRVVTIEDITRDEITALPGRIMYALNHPDRYNPTPANCRYCKRAHECPGRNALVRSAQVDLLEADPDAKALTPAALARLYPKAQLLRQVLAAYDTALKDAVEAAGRLPLGDGMELSLAERTRGNIRPAAARPVLEAAAGSDDVFDWLARSGAIEIRSGKLQDAVGALAARGTKGAVKAQLMADLESAGAIERTAYKVLTIRKEQ